MQDSLCVFRRRLLGDPSLQATLGAIERADEFSTRAVAVAASLGLELSTDALAAALRPDPLGLLAPPLEDIAAARPPKTWLPVAVGSTRDGCTIAEWAYFGAQRLTEPFFEMSARSALRLPFNRLCRWRMDFDAFLETEGVDESVGPPAGLVFHMSRCGSTLVAQMLAASPRHIVLSEAAPVDSATRLRELRPHATEADRLRALRAVTAALGRRRFAAEQRLFVKLDSWHSLALPLFRAAFPTTPWVFLYRNPVEVIVSQMQARGIQTVPGLLPAELQGLNAEAEVGQEEFCARALATGCAGAIEYFALGGGLLVNYDELPAAVFTKILPHFGVSPDAGEVEAMRLASRRDAKSPQFEFAADSEAKQKMATAKARAAAERWLGDSYAALEALRLGQMIGRS